ncbi:MAG: ParB/RepB/Spo0J family partition protein [Bacteroidota bacterium]
MQKVISASVVKLPVDKIIPDPNQPRREFDEGELKLLADSIRRHGLIQPIEVRPVKKKKQSEPTMWMITAGERRWRAHQIAKLELIDALVREEVTEVDDVLVRQVVENAQRLDLNPIEEANAFQQLIEMDWSIDKIARECSTKPFRIREKLALLKLTPKLQELVAKGIVSVTAGMEIAKLPEEDQDDLMAQLVKDGKVKNINEVRAIVQAYLDDEKEEDTGRTKSPKEEEDEPTVMEALIDRLEKLQKVVDKGLSEDEQASMKRSPGRARAAADIIKSVRTQLGRMERELAAAAEAAKTRASKRARAPKAEAHATA